MKKINKFLSIFALAAVLFTSCEVGLGPAVDMEPPVVTLTSHKDNDSVASTFRLVGTASDNEGVTKLKVDFEDKNIHFYVTGDGIWHKKTSASEWTIVDTERASVSFDGKTMNWWVEVDTTDSSETGNTFAFSIVAEDELGNTGKESKINCSLFIDENLPVASVIKPELGTNYNDSLTKHNSYAVRNANVIKYLKNGDLDITGRLDGAISSKELIIQFDNGTSSSYITGYGDAEITAAKVAEENTFGASQIYYSKTLKVGENEISDLRAWSFKVNQNEWVTDSLNSNLQTGKHLIRVVATSISSAFAYERKVLGWFTWYPEADAPWITMNSGTEPDPDNPTVVPSNPTEVVPSAKITGEAYDDDGIKSLTYTIAKTDDGSISNGSLNLSEANATSTSWAIVAPGKDGIYKVTVVVTDLNNSTYTISRFFKVLDVQAPSISITAPENHSLVLEKADASGNLTFTGEVLDDGELSSIDVIYLHPIANSDTSNITRYLSGREPFWNWADNEDTLSAKESEEFTFNGNRYKNIKFSIDLGNPVSVQKDGKVYNKYTFTKTLNLFTNLGITKDASKPLKEQYFVFRAKDCGGTSAVEQMYLIGDTSAPDLTLNTVQLNNNTSLNFPAKDDPNPRIPELPPVQAGTDIIKITGTWGDDSVTKFGKSKISSIVVNYSGMQDSAGNLINYPVTSMDETTGIWTAELKNSAPTRDGVITVKLKDFAGNETVVEKSLVINTLETGLSRVGCENEDGVYSNKKNSKLNITLEFNKSTKVVFSNGQEPEITFKNGGKAKYISGGTPNGTDDVTVTSTHVYEYTVGATDTSGKLLVDDINTNGAKWYDKTTGQEITITKDTLDGVVSLSTRNIVIDNTSPSVKNIMIMNSDLKPYKAGTPIVLMLEFDENVEITNVNKLQLVFKGQEGDSVVTTTSSAKSGNKFVLFTYTIEDGQNFTKLQFDKIKATENVTITDEQGNDYRIGQGSEIPVPSSITENRNIKIDTIPPSNPTVNITGWSNNDVITSELTEANRDDLYFTITGDSAESNATLKYTLDGTNYLTYTAGERVYLRNNGTYTIKAKQIDEAGNESTGGITPSSNNAYTLTIDRGSLIKNISSTDFSGTYKTGDTITGIIEFRKPVTITGGVVTLNVGNGIQKTLTAQDSITPNDKYTFSYTIGQNDIINKTAYPDELLDVISMTCTSVTLDGKTVPVTLPGVNDEARFKKQREIKILTGKPTKSTLTFAGEGTAAVLTVTYNRPITKNSAADDITFTMAEDDFKIPTVLSTSEYEELPSSIKPYYIEGVNGANVKGTGNSRTLENDTTKKYVLDFSKDDDDSAIRALFTGSSVAKHKVTIPMYSSAVKVNGSTLTVTLGSQYKLPVKGADYTLNIPAGAIKDTVGNESDVLTQTVTAAGIEKPVIRIKKTSQAIANPGNINTEVTMPETASLKITCQTPEADIYWKKEQISSSNVNVNRQSHDFTENEIATEKAKNPTFPNVTIDDNSKYTHKTDGETLGTSGLSYSTATGLKIAIAAVSKKGTLQSDPSYEYACRTVLKLHIADGQYGASGDVTSNIIKTGNTKYQFKELRIWVAGGDSPYGENSLSPFVLSWADSSNFKLMKGGAPSDNNKMEGSWYWVSWDVTAPTYHGFLLGDVPGDADTDGPTMWYVPEQAWVADKKYYVLYPGETITMCADTSTGYYYKSSFIFRIKNEGKR